MNQYVSLSCNSFVINDTISILQRLKASRSSTQELFVLHIANLRLDIMTYYRSIYVGDDDTGHWTIVRCGHKLNNRFNNVIVIKIYNTETKI